MLPTTVDGKYYQIEPVQNGEISPKDIIVFNKNSATIYHRGLQVVNPKNGKVFIKIKGNSCLNPDKFAGTQDMIIGKL